MLLKIMLLGVLYIAAGFLGVASLFWVLLGPIPMLLKGLYLILLFGGGCYLAFKSPHKWF